MQRERPARHRRRRVLTALLGLVFAVSLAAAVARQLDYRKGAADYAEAQQIAGITEPASAAPESPAGQPEAAAESAPPQLWPEVDLEALRAVNPDVVGWLSIPGTEISYPLVQAADNDYYLDHTWKREYGAVGAIFLECSVSADLSDFNTLVYGHRMRNGSMFGGLRDYRSDSFWRQAPSVYLTTDAGTARYDIFAGYEAPVSQPVFLPGQSQQAARQAILDYAQTHSVFDTGLTVSTDDRILTLVTCTGYGYASRWLIQAVYVGLE